MGPKLCAQGTRTGRQRWLGAGRSPRRGRGRDLGEERGQENPGRGCAPIRVELSRGGGCFWNEEGQGQAEDFGVVEGVAQSSPCGSTPPPLPRSWSFCIELPSRETVLDARAASCLGVLNGCTTGPAIAMRRVPWGSWWPRQEMLRTREDRRLKEELPGFQELAGEMG